MIPSQLRNRTWWGDETVTPSAPRPPRQRCSVLVEPEQIEIRDADVPEPEAGEVLIKVSAVGICGSDVHYYDDGRIGDHVLQAPLVLGHEASGVIVEPGEGVSERTPGQRVALEPQRTCGRCRECLTGRYNLCSQVRFFGTPPIDGAFCQYVILDAHRTHLLPDSMSDEAGALIEPLSVGVWAGAKAAIEPGDRVLVTGAGPVGLLAAGVARSRGGWVAVSDTNPYRLQVAASRGADVTIDPAEASPRERLGQFDVILECAGVPQAITAALEAAAPAARVAMIGLGQSEVDVPMSLIQTHEIRLAGVFRYANCYPAAIDLVAKGAVEVDSLVTGSFGLGEVESALTALRRDSHTLKPMVYPDR